MTKRNVQSILGAQIDVLSWDHAINQIVVWAASRSSRYICLCNVHSVVSVSRDPEFCRAINEADMAAPDGAPVAWTLRRYGFQTQERINGPDLMWRYLVEAERKGQSVFFYGSTPETLTKLSEAVARHFPGLQLRGTYSPPFRKLRPEEDEAEVELINQSESQVVFVGLGCPKQEKWMAAHRGRINAVMVGVGAAFDFHAGTKKRAPLWLQRKGLEWFYRLVTDPRRLFKRYIFTNTLFILGLCRQFLTRYFK